jgi:hypothetical protein
MKSMKEEQSPGLLFHEISEPQKHHFFSSFVRLRQKFIALSFKHSFKALKLGKSEKSGYLPKAPTQKKEVGMNVISEW